MDNIFVQTHNSKNSEDAIGLNCLIAILDTPLGFTLSRQQEIREATEIKSAQVYDACPALTLVKIQKLSLKFISDIVIH